MIVTKTKYNLKYIRLIVNIFLAIITLEIVFICNKVFNWYLELRDDFYQVANDMPTILKIIALVCLRFCSNRVINQHTESASVSRVFSYLMRQWEKERVRGKDGRLVVLRNSVLRVEGGRLRTKGRKRGLGPAREMYKGADDKTEVPAYQMLQCKLSAHSRRIRTKLPRDGYSHVFLKEIEKEKW